MHTLLGLFRQIQVGSMSRWRKMNAHTIRFIQTNASGVSAQLM